MKKFRLPIFLISILFLFGFLLSKTSLVLAVVEIEETFCNRTGTARDSRPNVCYVCNQNNLLTPSCATSIKVTTGADYGPLNTGPNFKVDWDGNINITPVSPDGNLKIPFVGMKGQEDENSYLADYFEGTNEYYTNYGNQTTLSNYQGILRKLAPLEYQNQLKKQLIARAPKEGVVKENPINDYKVVYTGRLCWDIPFWMDAGRSVFNEIFNLSFNRFIDNIKNLITSLIPVIKFEESAFELKIPDIGHYCLYENDGGLSIVQGLNFLHHLPGFEKIQKILTEVSTLPGLIHFSKPEMLATIEQPLSVIAEPEHIPPSPNEEQYKDNFPKYKEDFLKWKYNEDGSLSEWYLLWQAVPMLSLEDTLGKIEPYLNKENEKDQIDITSGETSTSSAVPHLARLYEGSKVISDLLTPVGEEGKMVEMVETPEIPETNPPNICLKENYSPPTGEGDDLCCGPVKVKFSAVDEFTDPGYYSNNCDTNPSSAVCQGSYTQTVSRNIGLNLKHPYLDEIWSYTTNANGGFFNIFRPHEYPTFKDIDATQAISYSGNFEPKDIVPNQGLFFYPHLGGIQTAKEWVINQALWPLCDKNVSSQCPGN